MSRLGSLPKEEREVSKHRRCLLGEKLKSALTEGFSSLVCVVRRVRGSLVMAERGEGDFEKMPLPRRLNPSNTERRFWHCVERVCGQ